MGQETILSSVMENTVAEEGAASHTNIKLDKLGNLTCIAGTNPERTIHASQATIRSFAGGEIYIGIPEMKYVDMDTGKRVSWISNCVVHDRAHLLSSGNAFKGAAGTPSWR